jgi:hypothetical protein
MRTRQQRQTNCVNIFLQCGFGNLFWQLMQTCVDHFKAVVTKGARDRLGATIMAIKAWLGHNYSVRTFHDSRTLRARQ